MVRAWLVFTLLLSTLSLSVAPVEVTSAPEPPPAVRPASPRADPKTSPDIGFLSWNVADLVKGDEGKHSTGENQAALTKALAVALRDDPTVFAFAYQECSMCIADMEGFREWIQVSMAANKKEDTYVYLNDEKRHAGGGYGVTSNTLGMHGASGIVVFKHKGKVLALGTSNTVSSERGEANNKQSEQKSIWRAENNEKGASVVRVELAPVVTKSAHQKVQVCFGSTHQDTGKWKKNGELDPTRQHQFIEHAKVFNDMGCDFKFFGGDFNWRNANWKDIEGIHPHFSKKSLNGKEGYFRKLKIDPTGYVKAEARLQPALADLINVHSDERKVVFEKGWSEGPGKGFLSMPPTFQPAKCPKDDKIQAVLLQSTPAKMGEKSDVGEKEAVCFPTGGGGNCGGANKNTPGTHLCFSAKRPVCYTDAIYHKATQVSRMKVTSLEYGVILGKQGSDHFPVVGLYTLQT